MTKLRIAAKVIELEDDFAIIECVDVGEIQTERSNSKIIKRINKKLLENIEDLDVGSIIDIKFTKEAGSLLINFSDGRKRYDESFFRSQSITSLDDFI